MLKILKGTISEDIIYQTWVDESYKYFQNLAMMIFSLIRFNIYIFILI